MPSEDSDQPRHSPRLIIILTGSILDSQGCKGSSRGQRRLIRLCGCAGRLESSLDENIKRYFFSHCGSSVVVVVVAVVVVVVCVRVCVCVCVCVYFKIKE